jgi:hypothetical protein
MQLLKKILNVFIPDSKTDIELFIESRHPKTTADVEHLIRQYIQRRNHDVL